MTQPFTPLVISQRVDEVLFHDFNFSTVCKRLCQCCSAFHYLNLLKECKKWEEQPLLQEEVEDEMKDVKEKKDMLEDEIRSKNSKATSLTTWMDDETKCCCIVDCGFSFTHVVPTFDARAVQKGIRRINIGGKILTNLLKEQISYRQWNMMDDFAIVNSVKEDTCFISPKRTDFDEFMLYARQTKKGLRSFDRDFVLPDFVHSFQGKVELPALLRRKMEWEERQREKKRKEEEEKQKKATEGEKGADTSGTIAEDNIPATSKEEDAEKNKTEAAEKDENYDEKCDASKNDDHDDKDNNNDDDDGSESDDNSDEEDEKTKQQKKKENLLRLQKQRQKEIERAKYIQEQEQQSLEISVERFTIPEIIFTPSYIGLVNSCGLGEAIVQSIQSCDAELRAALYHNIVLTGGTVLLPGFKERVEMEVRSLAPDNYVVRVFLPEDPVHFAWKGAHELVRQKEFLDESCMSKKQWEASKEMDTTTNQQAKTADDGVSPGLGKSEKEVGLIIM